MNCISFHLLQIDITVERLGYQRVAYTIFVVRYRTAALVSGEQFSCYLVSAKVACWGLNTDGQLGRNDVASVGTGTGHMFALSFVSFAASLDALGIIDVAAGKTHACAIIATTSATICWGNNDSGQLGASVPLGTDLGATAGSMASLIPVVFAPSITSANVVQVVAGNISTCGKTPLIFFRSNDKSIF
jgi:alpha-tubulin suppressor-like RCC1 family protein